MSFYKIKMIKMLKSKWIIILLLFLFILILCEKKSDQPDHPNQLPPQEKYLKVIAEEPAWSPDGRMLAYKQGDADKIWIFELASEKKWYVVDGMHPRWSPDGTRIGFTKPWVGGIYTINLGDSTIDTIISDPDRSIFAFDWSPDGEKICFDNHGGYSPFGFVVCNQDGSNWQPLSEKMGNRPDWSPDGNRVLGLGDRGVAFINSDGIGYTHLISVPSMDTPPGFLCEYWMFDYPIWTHDGEEIIWTIIGVRDSGKLDTLPHIPENDSIYSYITVSLWIMDSNGKNVRLLLGDTLFSSSAFRCYEAAVSPDGRYIAFACDAPVEITDTLVWRVKNIWIANIDGSNPRPLLPEN
jgi:Tol biopolymer transport system component